MKFYLAFLSSLLITFSTIKAELYVNGREVVYLDTNEILVSVTVTQGSPIINANMTGNTFNVTAGPIEVGSQTVGVSFAGATINAGTTIGGATGTVFLGGLGGGISNGVLTVDGSSVALGTNAPSTGTWILQSRNGTLAWVPASGFWGSNLSVQINQTGYAYTNIFTVSGTNDQTWTWGGGTTTLAFKVWGAGGGSTSGSGGNGHFVYGAYVITNGETLTIRVGYGGATNIDAYASGTNVWGWPGGGGYATNATSVRGGGGGYSCILSGTNLLILAAGGGGGMVGVTAGVGGYPSGTDSSGKGGTQSAGGNGSGSATAGSFLSGGSGTNGTTQGGGGGGIYGGGGFGCSACNQAAGGGASFVSSRLLIYYAVSTGLMSGDAHYGGNAALGGTSVVGNNGRVVVLTP